MRILITGGTGFVGVALKQFLLTQGHEVVILSQKMQELVAHSRPLAELKAQAFRDGYVPMRTYGWHKVMQGQTTIEEVISVTSLEIGGME